MTATRPILVLGAAGQLGSAIVRHFEAQDPLLVAQDSGPASESPTVAQDFSPAVIASTRADLDITDHGAVVDRIGALRPSIIINCAAYNRVDEAEQRPELALDVNGLAVRSIARAAARVEAVLVHYSTDFVFDGALRTPYTEEDAPNPRNVYGASKLLGDWFARDVARHYILRVESLFGGPQGASSVDRIVDALIEGREARVFTDRTISPAYAVDVVRATGRILEIAPPSGVYHCVNDGAITWEELAREAAQQLGIPARLVPIRCRDANLIALRPAYSVLSTSKLRRVGIQMPDWRDALRRYLAISRTR